MLDTMKMALMKMASRVCLTRTGGLLLHAVAKELWVPAVSGSTRLRCAHPQEGLDERDLRVISSALRAASGFSQNGQGRSTFLQSRSFSSGEEPFDLFARHLGSIFRGELEGLHGHLGSVFEEFERLGLPPREGWPHESVTEDAAEQLGRHQQPLKEVELACKPKTIAPLQLANAKFRVCLR